MLWMEMFYLILLLLLHFSYLSTTEKCHSDEYYSTHYKKCCERLTCEKGQYLGCLICESCEDGTFMNMSHRYLDNRTSCTSYSKCNPDQKEIFSGNLTHDKECVCNDGFVKNINYLNDCKKLNATSSSTSKPSEINNETRNILLKTLLPLFLITIVIIIIFVLCKWWRSSKRQRNNNCQPQKSDFLIAKENISANMNVLRGGMESSPGLFWAALKEGNGFSYEDQQICEQPVSKLDKNREILNLACNRESRMKSLIYALYVTKQEHLANKISTHLLEESRLLKDGSFVKKKSYKQRLTHNRVYIVTHMSLNGNVWQYLRNKDVFSEEEEETISKKMIETAQVDYLIELILKNETKYNHFLNALRETGNEHLFDLLSDKAIGESPDAVESECLIPKPTKDSVPSLKEGSEEYKSKKQTQDDKLNGVELAIA